MNEIDQKLDQEGFPCDFLDGVRTKTLQALFGFDPGLVPWVSFADQPRLLNGHRYDGCCDVFLATVVGCADHGLSAFHGRDNARHSYEVFPEDDLEELLTFLDQGGQGQAALNGKDPH